MNPVLLRRLLGAGVMLLMLFVASLLLPAPTAPKPAEPGMRRIEIAVDDTHPIVLPGPAASAAALSADAQQQAPPPTAAPLQPLGPGTPAASRRALAESAEAAAARFSGLSRETAPSPEAAGTAAEDDDDIAAAPSADTAADEPESKPAPTAESQPQTAPHRAPPAATPKPTPPVEPKAGAPGTSPAPRPIPAAPAVTTAQKPPAKPASTATPAPPAATASAASSPPRWAVQAGSYADIGNARQVEAQLRALGFSSSISLTESGGSARYRVRSGPYPTREAADAARVRMQQNRISANVVADGG